MTTTYTRVVGSNFTTFKWQGKDIAWFDSITDSGQSLYAAGGGTSEAVFALGQNYAKEIVTGRVLDIGTLTLVIRELWDRPAWQQLSVISGANNMSEIVAAVAASPDPITAQTIIKPSGSSSWRGWAYSGLVITNVTNGESITLEG